MTWIIGQENALGCLWNLSESGDILVQTCVAQRGKMDPFLYSIEPSF